MGNPISAIGMPLVGDMRIELMFFNWGLAGTSAVPFGHLVFEVRVSNYRFRQCRSMVRYHPGDKTYKDNWDIFSRGER